MSLCRYRVFLCHASDEHDLAAELSAALEGRGHDVFLDADDLPPAAAYADRIAAAVRRAHLFVFLISPASVTSGRFTLTELQHAQKKWKRPTGRVLAVMAVDTPIGDVPPYLRPLNILQARGNLVAEVADAVADLARRRCRKVLSAAAAGVLVLALGGWLAWRATSPNVLNPRLVQPPGTETEEIRTQELGWTPELRLEINVLSGVLQTLTQKLVSRGGIIGEIDRYVDSRAEDDWKEVLFYMSRIDDQNEQLELAKLEPLHYLTLANGTLYEKLVLVLEEKASLLRQLHKLEDHPHSEDEISDLRGIAKGLSKLQSDIEEVDEELRLFVDHMRRSR